MRNLSIIFFADCWDIQWRRRQQISFRLSQEERIKHVVYVEKPLPVSSFIKYLIGKADLDGTDRWERVLSNRSLQMIINDKLSILATLAPFPVMGPDPLFRLSEKARQLWVSRELNKLLKRHTPRPFLVWVSFPQLPLETIRKLNPDFLWYDCTEDFSAFPYPDCVRRQVIETDKYLTEKADVVSAVSRILYEEKKKLNSRTIWLPNAVDTDIFFRSVDSLEVPPGLRQVRRPILAFVGGMCEWAHDWKLLDIVASKRPQWTILLIGDITVSTETREMLKSHPNILRVGQLPYEMLPSYLLNSDVCFLFYKLSRGNNSRNSQKLFLYMASGKPTVSTPSADIQSYKDYVYIADTPETFITSVEKALSERSSSEVVTYREIARRNSWAVRIEEINKILSELMG